MHCDASPHIDPMPHDDSFTGMMERLAAGDERAAREVFDRFASQLVVRARTHLSERLRQKVDPDDVVQSALKSFFVRQAKGDFALEGWDSLWGLLVRITLRKCAGYAEHFQAQRRNVNRELAPVPMTGGSSRGWEAMARDPSPAEAAALAETVEQLMSQLDERKRQMLALRLQGFTVPEISTHVGRTERTVERLLEQVRGKLTTILA